MAMMAEILSALAVSRLKTPGLWAAGGVPGLYLAIGKRSSRSWILRVVIGTKRRDMGLGSYPAVTLAMARERARAARTLIDAGVDPIEQRKHLKSGMAAKHDNQKTFVEAARAYIASHSSGWKGTKSARQWEGSLGRYAYPIMGGLPVQDIGQPHVLAVLEAIWIPRTETANRVRGRIENILDWATVRGFRKGDNPARWRGHLDKLLPAPSKLKRTVHYRALEIDGMGTFMEALRKFDGIAARALEFAILTAVRSGDVRGAAWSEIDLQGAIWTIPPERMKAGRGHRVPLSEQAIKLLRSLPRIEGNDLVFPGPRGGRMGDVSLSRVTRAMGDDASPHGFRSSFRDWVSERTNYSRDLAETALAHTLESKTEAAYRRGDALEKRRHMMNAWANHCDRSTADGIVLPFAVAAP